VLNEVIEAQRIANIRRQAPATAAAAAAAAAAAVTGMYCCGSGVFSEIISVFIISPTIPARFRDIRATLAAADGVCHGAARSIGLGNDLRH